MTRLEQETFADGFRVGLLGVAVDPARDRLGWAWRLFDGGRAVASAGDETCFSLPEPGIFVRLRACLAKVMAPPHVLAVCGGGWRALLEMFLPLAEVSALRVLDLRAAAVAFRPGLPQRSGLEEVLRAYRVATAVEEGALLGAAREDLLWAVVGAAGAAGLGWPELLDAAGARRAPPFERFAFGADTLAALPSVPAVYVLHDAEGAAVYVGQTGDLARRMAEHFRSVREPDAKREAMWERVHDIEFHAVGSELEAQLLEQRTIEALAPALNTQRRVAEGASRYAFPRCPVAVVCPSARPRRAELFLLGEGCAAVQVRLDPARPPRAMLARWVRHFTRGGRRPKPTATVTDWGRAGNEIACRWFARRRDRLQWLELPAPQPPAEAARRLLEVVRIVAARRPDPGEFRVNAE